MPRIFEQLETTGRWWEGHDLTAHISARPDRERCEQAIAELVRHYSSEWALKAWQEKDRSDPFLCRLVSGLTDKTSLLACGFYLLDLGRHPGFPAVFARMRHGPDGHAAWLEAQMAHLLFREGFEVTFPPAKASAGKTADIRATRGDETLFVECKSLSPRGSDERNREYGMQLSQRLLNALPRQVGYQLAIRALDADELPHAEKCSTTAVQAFVQALIQLEGRPEHTFEGQYVSGRLARSPDSAESYIAQPADDDYRWLEKVVSNGIEPAARQLAASGEAGLAAILLPTLPALHRAQQRFAAFCANKPELTGGCTAVLLMPWLNLVSHYPPFLLVNPSARRPLRASFGAMIIAAAMGAVIADTPETRGQR
jgi:hypothetical protein